MQRGSRIRLTPYGVVRLWTGHGSEFGEDTPPSLEIDGGSLVQLRGYEVVYDLVLAGELVAVLHEGFESNQNVVETGPMGGPLRSLTVPGDCRRVALTRSRLFLGSRRSLLDVDGRSLGGNILDLACTPERVLLSLGEKLTELDADGRLVDRYEPGIGRITALDSDSIEGGWLLASEQGIFTLAPLTRGKPTRLAPALDGRIDKVRRWSDGVWALVKGQLVEAGPDGIRELQRISDNSWYWEDFDANHLGRVLTTR